MSRRGNPSATVRLPALLALLAAAAAATGATLTSPGVDGFNIRVGTQIFGPEYQFTSQNVLVEAAQEMLAMGSDTIKFAMGWGARGQYDLVFGPAVTSLAGQAQHEPVTKSVLDMPFRHIFVWAHSMTPVGGMAHWTGGVTAQNATLEYNEIYNLAAYLLTRYNGTGKSFYLGHWEGDWLLLENYDASVNPSPTRIQGMIDWLNIRQQAVDDARAAVPHSGVNVFHYTEVNRVRDAMVNGTSNNQRVVNAVLPHVPAMDCVSYSCYDAQSLSEANLHATLDYIDTRLGDAKDTLIPGRRVFIGEYGWGKWNDSASQEPLTRDFIRKVLNWGVPHILFWELYNNEPGKMLWLIDSAGNGTPCYDLHVRFGNLARLEAGRFLEGTGRLPDPDEFASLMAPHLLAPLPPPQPFTISQSHRPSATAGIVIAEATVTAGIYGEEAPEVFIHWGPADGGTNAANWQSALNLGKLLTLQPAAFAAPVTVASAEPLFYRFRAANASGAVWAPASGHAVAEFIDASAFRYRMRATLAGFIGTEPATDFPVLVKLDGTIPGFSYSQFALPGGADLRVTAADGATPLPFTIARWNPSGVSTIWVRLPAASGAQESFWLHWGSSAPPGPQQPPAQFWSAGQSLAIDFDDATAPFADRSGQTVPAVSAAAPALVEGIAGNGAQFSGASTHLRVPAFDPGAQFTLRAWVRPAAGNTSIQTLWSNKVAGWNSNGIAWFFNDFQTTSASLILETGNGSTGAKLVGPSGAVGAGAWHHLAAVVDPARASAVLYVDGVVQPAKSTLFQTFNRGGDWWLGRFADGSFPLNAALDEVHADRVTRSAAWIRNNHANLADPGYVGFSGMEERQPVLAISAGAGFIRLEWPAHYADWRLETSGDLSTWQPMAVIPVVTGDKALVEIDARSISQPVFFRLAQ